MEKVRALICRTGCWRWRSWPRRCWYCRRDEGAINCTGNKKPAEPKAERVHVNESVEGWCPEPESNRHAAKRQILSLLCLPVPPSGQHYSTSNASHAL